MPSQRRANVWCETGLESLIFHKIIPQIPQELPVVPWYYVSGIENQNEDTPQQRLKDFEVNTNQVKVWMQYLFQHNCWYQNVVQDVHRLDAYVSRLEDMSS